MSDKELLVIIICCIEKYYETLRGDILHVFADHTQNRFNTLYAQYFLRW